MIATAAFGLKVDSLKDKENPFYKTGMKMMNFNIRALIMFLVLAIYPKIMKVGLIPKEVIFFFFYHLIIFSVETF